MKTSITGGVFGLLLLTASCFGLTTNTIVFYLHPDLVATTNMGAIQTNLAKYVGDINYVLAKNTNRRWEFDPATGIIVTNESPSDGIEPTGGGPTNEYPVWVWIQRSFSSVSFGGSLGIDSSGPAVINSLFWRRFYDPDTVTSEMEDYKTQIATMLHEYGHIFGVAGSPVGEYYRLGPTLDDTETPPQLDTRFLIFENGAFAFNVSDPYWTEHLDHIYDPMLWYATVSSRSDMLSKLRYAELSAEIINRSYRAFEHNPPMPSLTQLRVKVLDGQTCLPVSGARVKIWRIASLDNQEDLPTTLLVNTTTGASGEIIWSWTPHTGSVANDNLRLIKVSRAGYPTNAQYVSAIDLQASRVLDGHGLMTNYIKFTRPKLRILPVGTNQVVRVTNCIPENTFIVYGSTDLQSWIALRTNTPTTTSLFTFTNTLFLGQPRSFYVAKEPSAEFCPVPIIIAGGESMMMMQQGQSEAQLQAGAEFRKSSFPKKVELPPLPKLKKLQ